MTTLPGPESMVHIDVCDQVATIVIDRPCRHNSLVPQLLTQLSESFRRVGRRSDVRVIVLKAVGKSFSIGGDLGAFCDHEQEIELFAEQLVGALNQAILSIDDCDVPVVVAVDGRVTGGALGLVLACDIVVVTERATFTPYYVDVGFSPDGGWTAILPDMIGRGRATAVQLLNDSISARQAVEWGIAYKLASSVQLDHAIAEITFRLVRKKPGSMKSTKRLMRNTGLRKGLDHERRMFVQKIGGREALDGLKEFVTKRKPDL